MIVIIFEIPILYFYTVKRFLILDTDFNTFIQKLEQALKKPLPGRVVQYAMAPGGRDLEDSKRDENELKESAVTALLFPEKGKIKLLIMKRVTDNTVHSGQLSFPGGSREPEDKTLKETALREMREEMGIPFDKVNIIGRLTPVIINASGFKVNPFVAYCAKSPDLKPNEEVEKVIKADIGYLLNPNSKTVKIVKARGRNIEAPCFVLENEILWGATAMMTNELLEIIKTIDL